MSRRRFAAAFVVPMLIGALAHAQSFRRRFIEQNEPPATEFVAARWRFGTNGWFGHMGWSHNDPASDQNLNAFLDRTTVLDVMSYRIVELGSDEVFNITYFGMLNDHTPEILLTAPHSIHARCFREQPMLRTLTFLVAHSRHSAMWETRAGLLARIGSV